MNEYWVQIALALMAMGGLALAVWIAGGRLPRLPQSPTGTIAATGEGVAIRTPEGRHVGLPWAEVERVSIRTTDRGPAEQDVWWHFEVIEGRGAVSVPNDTDGIGQFLEDAPQWLEGFDQEAIIEAMGSTGNGEFVVWSRSD